MMNKLTKEKYYEALGYLFNHAHNCTNCDRVNIDCDGCETDNTMECDIAHFRLSNLIDEHFELKEKYSKILDDVHDYRNEAHLCKMQIRNLIVHFGVTTMEELTSIYYNRPLKFEELEVGMWVWDRELSAYIQIYAIYDTVKGIRVSSFGTFEFEENRYFRYEVK